MTSVGWERPTPTAPRDDEGGSRTPSQPAPEPTGAPPRAFLPPPEAAPTPLPYTPPPEPPPTAAAVAWPRPRPPAGELRASPPTRRRLGRPRLSTVLGACVALLLALLVASTALLVQDVRELRSLQEREAATTADRLGGIDEKQRAQNAATNGLSERLGKLEQKVDDQPDLAKVAASVEPSVFTIRTGDGVGSGFAFTKVGTRTGIVTNYHVVANGWERGRKTVSVLRDDLDVQGLITTVDPSADLALVTVDGTFPLLSKASAPPKIGDPVLAVGSPLGLGGSASSGIVSAERDGRLQFSAPVSPGNSGGPVVDRTGKVLGVTTSKLVEEGVEGLAFAIPVSRVCATVVSC